MSKNFVFVKFENNILTTMRDHARHEDFQCHDGIPDLIEASKHYGDHEWDTSTNFTVPLEKDESILNILIKAAIMYHHEMGYELVNYKI